MLCLTTATAATAATTATTADAIAAVAAAIAAVAVAVAVGCSSRLHLIRQIAAWLLFFKLDGWASAGRLFAQFARNAQKNSTPRLTAPYQKEPFPLRVEKKMTYFVRNASGN